MKIIVLGALLATVLMIGAGCGGNGANPYNPYAGTYSGTWETPVSEMAGTMTLAVDNDGNAEGTIENTTRGLIGGVLQARLLDDGTFSGVAKYPTEASFIITGKVSLDYRGGIAGTVTHFQDKVADPMALKLKKN